MKEPVEIESRLFRDDGRTPNHPRLPLVVMRRTRAAIEEDPAGWFEEKFQTSGWRNCWRWTVYPYHHFHSINHEVLGVSHGEARLMLGGEQGEEFTVRTGDVIIIPAGVGHKRVEASDDFQVVGAYPGGLEPDLLLPGEDIGRARERIAGVAFPGQDPVYGPDGPLFDCWKT